MDDLEKALGQFILYRSVLAKRDPDRELFLAVPFDAAAIFDEPLGKLLLEDHLLQVITFDPVKEVLVRWIP